ncbi:protein ELYS isoform X2 [Nymphalis io]|uniref:protein ELYS isoform X2 n=1 Tax=Inachis io TaxID=171585 RepID=UPI002169E917|nr:protein ELYS isoform X2 [Nymphalis io]
MQKLQESVFSIVKTTSLSSAVFSFLQPSEDFLDKTPLGGILRDTKYAWLALGPKFCVVDLRSGLKIAARTFGNGISSRISVTSVVEIPTPLTDNSRQLIISLECDDTTSLVCVFHVNGSQLLRCIQTDVVITELAVCDGLPNGPLMCFNGLVMAGTRKGEIIIFDLNRASLIQALKDISQGYEQLVRGENNVANLIFLPFKAINKIESQRELAVENDDHLALLLNEDSFLDDQFIFRNPDGTVRMKAKQSHIRITVAQYIPQLGSLAVGFNFGAFQIWNILNLELEFTSQVNVECLPVTHFGYQEPCDDPRAFCYLWVVFSVLERFEEEEFPLAVMYSLTYQGKRMLSDTKCLYQEFLMATIRFQIELSAVEETSEFIGGKCISCHTYSISSTLGEEGEDTMLNLCQLVWECWGENQNARTQHGMLLFDLDQWYKDQMPATQRLGSNAFMSTARCPEVNRGSCQTLDLRLDPTSVSPYSHATRLEEHFYPNSLQYDCVWLNTSGSSALHTAGVQRQLVRGVCAGGPACLLAPAPLAQLCRAAGLAPLYAPAADRLSTEEQRRFLLSVALEARLSRFLKRCAHDWATGTHSGVGCTLPFLVDWSWKRAIELKENAKELTAPLFTSSTMPDRNVVRCLEHCVQQLTQLTGLLDAVLTKCCNLVVPDALSEMEEKYKGIGTVSLYFQVVQWFVRVGLLPERFHSYNALPYPAHQLQATYNKRRVKLNRLQDKSEDESTNKSCSLLYIDQLIENEFGGERVHQMWLKAGSECGGLYPPPSLYALLRLYLLPDIAEEHKHSLLLYLLLDYSMLYDEMRYEAVIRRLMQFPTMFGLSNTAIKATQAFWHLDHRDFDFALDQLQCLTGNTLSDWQHHVVLSSLLAQKKTQAALQYLHVRKPAPIQNMKDGEVNAVNDHDKLNDWQSCCDLYLARGLVYEALDVIRMCVQNAASADDKIHLLNFFYKGCRNTGQLSKVLQATLLPFEEEVFINYLKDCNEPQTSDILVMYFLQQGRYLEAERYNEEQAARGAAGADPARDALVELLRAAVPAVAADVARVARAHDHTRVIKSKPMSVYVQATSPKNTFTYKSTFIQDTIENASETWINKPKMRKGLKRALNIEETPFICTPKLYKTKSILSSEQKGSEATPPKRAKLDLTGTPRTPKNPCTLKVSETLSRQMASLLDMPEVESPHKQYERSGAETPHSILKNRRLESRNQDAPSPVDSRYLDSDEELETASNHTHYSDSNKLLRFTIPTASEAGSTPSPVPIPVTIKDLKEESPDRDLAYEETDKRSNKSETHPMESPPKKFAAEEKTPSRKSYKDSVRARKSLSISANSSLSDDPNTSIESIADIPITLINPRYLGNKKYSRTSPIHTSEKGTGNEEDRKIEVESEMGESIQDSFVPRTPKSRRSIRTGVNESTPLVNRSRPTTPERQDSPAATLRADRTTRSRTPELSPRSSLAPIPEQAQEVDTTPRLRSRSRTPDALDKVVKVPHKLETIKESAKPTESPSSSPTRRSLRSRSRTPEVELTEQPMIISPRSLRSRSKTPDKLMSPKKEHSTRSKRSLSRMVLEANAFAKTKQQTEKMETETIEEKIESTPVKTSKDVTSLMDVTFSPIVNKSVLQSSTESFLSVTTEKTTHSSDGNTSIQVLPAFTTINEIYVEKSVLHSYQSSVAETTQDETKDDTIPQSQIKSLPAFTTLNEDIDKSVLNSFESSMNESSLQEKDIAYKTPNLPTTSFKFNESDIGNPVLGSNDNSAAITDDSVNQDKNLGESSLMTSDSEIEIKDNWKSQVDTQETARVIQKEKEKIVEIEREINEIEGEMSDECQVESNSSDSSEEVAVDSSESVEDGSSEEEVSDSDSDSESEGDNEVISIADSDDSTEANKLHIEEDAPVETEKEQEIENFIIEEVIEMPVIEKDVIVENPIEVEEQQKPKEQEEMVVETTAIEDSREQLNQARNMSILTDDNSFNESDQSVNLNYSDENKIENDMKEENIEAMVIDQVVDIDVIVEVQPVINTEALPQVVVVEKPSDIETMDVVDASINIETPKEIETIADPVAEQAALPLPQESIQKRKDESKSTQEKEKQTHSRHQRESTTSNKSEAKVDQLDEADTSIRKGFQSTASKYTPRDTESKSYNPAPVQMEITLPQKSLKGEKEESIKTEDEEKPTHSRQQTKSKTSNKSKDEVDQLDEPKTSIPKENRSPASNDTPKEKETMSDNPMPEQMEITLPQESIQEKKEESKSTENEGKPVHSRKRTKSTTSNKSKDKVDQLEVQKSSTHKTTQSTASSDTLKEIETISDKSVSEQMEVITQETHKEKKEESKKSEDKEKSTHSRQRTTSTTSNKSKDKVEQKEKTKTSTRKRTQSKASDDAPKETEIVSDKPVPEQMEIKLPSESLQEYKEEIKKSEDEKPTHTRQRTKSTTSKQSKDKVEKLEKTKSTRKRNQSTASDDTPKEKDTVSDTLAPEQMEVTITEESLQDQKEESKKNDEEKRISSKKQNKSTTINKSKDEVAQSEEPKTPLRKRTQSTASNKSDTEQKTPENEKNVEVSTPSSRRRAKTPTSTEVRKILTRRASKELMEQGEDESIILEDTLTPRRRSTRSRSKKDDDNISVTSETSGKSSRSRVSEDGDAKSQVRKGRKSILSTKPDLSVIPEVTSEESKTETAEDIVNELGTRRLTRNQKAVLESWLEPSRSRRDSLTDRADEAGSPDPDEMRNSPDSSFAIRPRPRIARSASETTPNEKPARIARRTSVDIVASGGSPAGSPARARRVSFARACEALHTPRRASADARKDDSISQPGSPPETPTRKQADTSQVKESARKTRRNSEKNKETKE